MDLERISTVHLKLCSFQESDADIEGIAALTMSALNEETTKKHVEEEAIIGESQKDLHGSISELFAVRVSGKSAAASSRECIRPNRFLRMKFGTQSLVSPCATS